MIAFWYEGNSLISGTVINSDNIENVIVSYEGTTQEVKPKFIIPDGISEQLVRKLNDVELDYYIESNELCRETLGLTPDELAESFNLYNNLRNAQIATLQRNTAEVLKQYAEYMIK
jgi:hypothetical protein